MFARRTKARRKATAKPRPSTQACASKRVSKRPAPKRPSKSSGTKPNKLAKVPPPICKTRSKAIKTSTQPAQLPQKTAVQPDVQASPISAQAVPAVVVKEAVDTTTTIESVQPVTAPVTPSPSPDATPPRTPAQPAVVDPAEVPNAVGSPADEPVPAGPAAQLSPIATYRGPFGRRQAERLLWRAGFGPRPGEGDALAGLGLASAVLSITRPPEKPALHGPEPTVDGRPIDPLTGYCHDQMWWLDRMVRTDAPLVERMTLLWHDWFATSKARVRYIEPMLDQNELFRRHALGNFHAMTAELATDIAMGMWLDIFVSTKSAPNENFARELMELFTLGAHRGAYTEDDVREAARAVTGWVMGNDDDGKLICWFDPKRHDQGTKTIFGQTGRWDLKDLVRLCVEHPMHASYVVERLWDSFIATPITSVDRLALERLYVDGGHEVRPVIEAILLHPTFYTGPELTKPPVVFVAGMLRAQERGVADRWFYSLDEMQQRLFLPPEVDGWHEDAWLNTSTVRGHWNAVNLAAGRDSIAQVEASAYPATETAEQAVEAARRYWNDPLLTPGTIAVLTRFAERAVPLALTLAEKRVHCAQRQNALRQLIGASPDLMWC